MTFSDIVDPEPKTAFMLTNHAVARAVLESDAKVTAFYSGSPTSEILDSLMELSRSCPDLVMEQLRKRTDRVWAIDANALAEEAGNPRTENVVLLGAASRVEGFPLPRDALVDAVKKAVPERTVAANLAAFELGEKSLG